ncbi:hypothetical protein PAMA_003102 [Pampus argenteus]
MKTLAILSLGLVVALGMPLSAPDVAPNPVLAVKELNPVRNLVVVQGRVVVEQQEKLAPETDQSPVDVQVKNDSMMELEVEVKPEDKMDPKLKEEQEVMMEKDVKVDPEVKAGAEDPASEVMAESDDKVKLEVEMESELNVSPDLKVASEVKVDFHWEPQVNPMFSKEQKVQEEFQMEMNHDQETRIGMEVEERHIDMEGKSEMMGESIVEWGPLDEDNEFNKELSNAELTEEEKSLRAAFQNRDPDTEPLPEEEGSMGRSNDVLDGEPIMEIESETKEEPFLYQQVMTGSHVMDEGPVLDMMGQPVRPLGDYFPNEEAMMGMELAKQRDSNYLMMERAGSEFVKEEEYPVVGMPLFEEPAMEDSPPLDGGVRTGVVPEREKMALMQQGV